MNLVGNVDARLVLLFVGFLLTILARNALESANAFIQSFSETEMIAVVCTVMGYYRLMEKKGCNQELSAFMRPYISKIGFLIIPVTVFISFIFNILLPSALGCAAVVGSVLIPVLRSANIDAKLAGCAVIAGTFGSVLNVHSVHSEYIARNAGLDVYSVVQGYSSFVWLGLCIVAACLWIGALVIHKHIFHKTEDFPAISEPAEQPIESTENNSTASVNYLMVCLPALPMAFIIITSLVPFLRGMTLTAIMLNCLFLVLLLFRNSIKESAGIMFNGMGDAFSKAVLAMAAAAVLVNGLESLQMITFIMNFLQQVLAIKSAAAVTPFILALVTGSGDTATLVPM